jgi:hypothetical protein
MPRRSTTPCDICAGTTAAHEAGCPRQRPVTRRASKFGARPTTAGGVRFASAKEARRHGELLALVAAGAIGALRRQVPYRLVVNGHLIATYYADAVYLDYESGEEVVEDVKSAATRRLPVYRLKRRLMAAIHGIEIREV